MGSRFFHYTIAMIARMQATWTVLLLLGAGCWVGYAAQRSWALAGGGIAVGVLVYLGVMALQFTLMQRVNAADPAPRARPLQVLRAWWAELGVALHVFCWDQPFRSRAEPNWLPTAPTGQRGVVLVHGFLCNRALWRTWFAPLRAAGHAYEAVNLEPVFGSIDDYAPTIDAAVQRVHAATGMAPVLICHSMGGLAARAWLRACAGDARVQHVVTLGTPHRGTWAGRFARAVNARQMALDGDWVGQLSGAEPAGRAALFTCWYSNCDNIVFPTSTATLPKADNRHLPGVAHVEMARRTEVLRGCLALLISEADSAAKI
ncbi:MAG: alpha/beta fold hydrolase [Burkholderiaceae bacterium]|nr:alpha/beta fold hydrolase [Burkholderiaceae bacterium]